MDINDSLCWGFHFKVSFHNKDMKKNCDNDICIQHISSINGISVDNREHAI